MDEDFDKILAKFEISVLPTFIFFHNGKIVDKLSGSNMSILKAKTESLNALKRID